VPPLHPRPSASRGKGAQQPVKISRIGVLAPGCYPPSFVIDAFLQGLRDLGYVEGQNIAIEWRFFQGRADPFPPLAAHLVRLPLALIVSVGTPAALPAEQTTPAHPAFTGPLPPP